MSPKTRNAGLMIPIHPRHHCRAAREGHVGVIKALLKAGATIKRAQDYTPLVGGGRAAVCCPGGPCLAPYYMLPPSATGMLLGQRRCESCRRLRAQPCRRPPQGPPLYSCCRLLVQDAAVKESQLPALQAGGRAGPATPSPAVHPAFCPPRAAAPATGACLTQACLPAAQRRMLAACLPAACRRCWRAAVRRTSTAPTARDGPPCTWCGPALRAVPAAVPACLPPPAALGTSLLTCPAVITSMPQAAQLDYAEAIRTLLVSLCCLQ